MRLSPEEQALYEQLRASPSQELAEAKKDPDRDAGDMLRFVLLAALTRLRQLCCHPRLVYPRTDGRLVEGWRTCWSCWRELREDGHRALVFSQFRSFLDCWRRALRQHGFRVLVLDGTTPAEARARADRRVPGAARPTCS